MKPITILRKALVVLLSIGVDLAIVAYAFKAEWKEDTLFSIILFVLLIAGARHIDFYLCLIFYRISQDKEF